MVVSSETAMFEVNALPETVRAILEPHEGGRRLMPLAPRKPLAGPGVERLRQTDASDFGGGESGQCVRSALFLYFSALDESHVISQGISSSTGSLLHGIMHREEPDYSNAKYWFRRSGPHEIFPALREGALQLDLGDPALLTTIEQRPEWDAFWFVDQCERGVREGGAREESLLEIQSLEWRLALEHSLALAR